MCSNTFGRLLLYNSFLSSNSANPKETKTNAHTEHEDPTKHQPTPFHYPNITKGYTEIRKKRTVDESKV
ncbi:hypothetical protein HanPI659440_Chr11g0430301 [Helianthus annuus]|nr:hypothetical protein HanPI659440_Chr11g0430301 [Helianthus annuus]